MNLFSHAPTLKVRRKLVRSRSSSNSSGSDLVCARLSTSLMTLASTSDAGEDRVTGLIGHLELSWSHSGPCCQSAECTGAPLLARSAGFSSVGTYLHSTSLCSCILATRFATNCLYWPFPLIQWSATVLSNHPNIFGEGTLSRALRTFTNRLVAMCAAINSRRGIVSPCLASRLLATTNRWVLPDGWRTTA